MFESKREKKIMHPMGNISSSKHHTHCNVGYVTCSSPYSPGKALNNAGWEPPRIWCLDQRSSYRDVRTVDSKSYYLTFSIFSPTIMLRIIFLTLFILGYLSDIREASHTYVDVGGLDCTLKKCRSSAQQQYCRQHVPGKHPT